MKDPHHIALRPSHHWTDNNIRVHVFTCVIAFMLISLLQREIHLAGMDLSMTRILELLGGIREVITAFPPSDDATQPTLRLSLTKMNDDQRRLFEILHLGRFASA